MTTAAPLNIQRVRQAFSKSAIRYEALAGLQQQIGQDLLSRLPADQNLARVLDVGMGTGLLTQGLAEKFTAAQVVGIDFADGMVNCAVQRKGHFRVVQADAMRLPFQAKAFDLIVSNLAYQWAAELSVAFGEVRRCLKAGQYFSAALFSAGSLPELSKALAQAGVKNLSLAPMPSSLQVDAALRQAGFGDIQVKVEKRISEFQSLQALLLWLKNIGANVAPRPRYLGKAVLAKAEKYYQENFSCDSGVRASFEVIWLEAKKE